MMMEAELFVVLISRYNLAYFTALLQPLDSGQSNIHTMNRRLAQTKNHLLF